MELTQQTIVLLKKIMGNIGLKGEGGGLLIKLYYTTHYMFPPVYYIAQTPQLLLCLDMRNCVVCYGAVSRKWQLMHHPLLLSLVQSFHSSVLSFMMIPQTLAPFFICHLIRIFFTRFFLLMRSGA